MNAALEDLGNLSDLDLQRIYVNSFTSVKRGGDFVVLDERTGVRSVVASTFPQVMVLPTKTFFILTFCKSLSCRLFFFCRPCLLFICCDFHQLLGWISVLTLALRLSQAIAVALRYRQPFFVMLEALLSANKDFIDRMLINPLGEYVRRGL